MSEVFRSALSTRSAPWGLIGMVALVLLAERFVERRGLDLLDMDDWAYRDNAKAAAKAAGRYDVLCFGDSLMKLTVVPKAVEARTGLRVYNLAVSGSQAPSTHVMLKRVLASGKKPAAVLVDFQPPLMRLDPRHNLNRWANLLSYGEAAELASWARDADLFTTIALGRLLPSYQRRTSIRASIVAALGGTVEKNRWLNFLAFRHWKKNAGAQLMSPAPALATLPDAEVEKIRQGFYPRWECHPANIAGVLRFLELAHRHDIPVYWVLPPHLPALQSKLASSGIDAHHEAFLRAWQARFPNLTVLDGRGKIQDATAFYDANHLAAQSAYGFSLAVGDALRGLRRGTAVANPPTDRWVVLRDARPEPLPEGLEDLHQSEVALQAVGKAVR